MTNDEIDLSLRIWDAAIHESGHVVVQLELGYPVTAVWVDEDGTGKADIEPYRRLPPEHCPREMRESIDVCVAGRVAEDLYDEWNNHDEWQTDGGWQDVVELMAMARCEAVTAEDRRPRYPSSLLKAKPTFLSELLADPGHDISVALDRANRYLHPMAEIEAAERRVEQILKERWDAVLKLAGSLYRRKSHRMTGKQVRRLIGADQWEPNQARHEERCSRVGAPELPGFEAFKRSMQATLAEGQLARSGQAPTSCRSI